MQPNDGDVSDVLSHAWQSRITYTLEEFKAELKLELASRPELDGNADVSKCILALGEAGIGKTQAIRQALMEVGGEYLMYHHGATMEEDNAGTPFQEKINERTITRIAIPDHLACFYREPTNGVGALVIEEIFTGSTTGHQNQARQFIDRRFGLHPMFPTWRVVATSNPESADYGTVKAADKALAKRMIIFPIKPTAAEKLQYWQGKMDDVLFKFHLVNHLENLSFVEATDSRSWMNISDSLSRRRMNGQWLAPIQSLAKLVSCHASRSVGAAFEEFLKKGNDPDEYPVSHMTLLTGSGHEQKLVHARFNKWMLNRRTALIGATTWGLNAFLRTYKVDALKGYNEEEAAVNLAAYLRILCEVGYTDMAADIFNSGRQTSIMRLTMTKVNKSVDEKIGHLWASLRGANFPVIANPSSVIR